MSRHRCAVALRRDASRGGEDFRDRDDRRRVVAANRSKPDKTGDKRRGLAALEALNFFMADMQAGIGPFLGVFLLAMIPMARGIGAFVGLIAGMSTVAAVAFGAPQVSFLWHNVIGALTVVAVGLLLSLRKAR